MAQDRLENIKERRRRQREKDQAQQKTVNNLNPEVTAQDTPQDVETSGQDKLNSLLFKKALLFVAGNLEVLDRLLTSTGLPNSEDLKQLKEQGEEKVLEFVKNTACPSKEILEQAVSTRDVLNTELSKLGSYYKLTNEAISNLNNFLTGQLEAAKLIKNLNIITSQAAKAIPTPPGVPGIIPASLNDLSILVDSIIFSTLGTPKLAKLKATVDSGLTLISLSSQTLLRLLEPLDILDLLLEKCGQTLTPRPDSIKQLQQVYQTTTQNINSVNYKGFTLEIEEVPFSKTVNRRRAIGKNTQGIILIQTDLSFTTNPQILLDQLKFIIDSQNLKPF